MVFKVPVFIKKYILGTVNLFVKIFSPEYGVKMYSNMQKRAYKKYTGNMEDAKNLCVGRFAEHEQYPYEKYLLERFSGEKELALDFGCGVGRMMNRMLTVFTRVDGIDLSDDNLQYAKEYLNQNNWPADAFALYQSDGTGCKINNGLTYNFIYSTICLQHIAVHTIRYRIIEDMYHLLKKDGVACLQFGYGWDNGTYWMDDYFAARSSNAGHDFSVPDQKHLEIIRKDMLAIGFKEVLFDLHASPHTDMTDYHSQWLFMTLLK